MNKYQELITALTAVKENKQAKINALNAQIIYHVAVQEGLEKDIQNVVADREELEGIRNTKENSRSLIHRNIIGDIKVSAFLSLIPDLAIIFGAGLSPLALLVSLIIFCLISGIAVALDPGIKYVQEINKTYDLIELDTSISEKREEEQELRQSQKQHFVQARELQERRKQELASITELNGVIDMLNTSLDALIEAILTQNTHNINRDFMTNIKEDVIRKILANKEGK